MREEVSRAELLKLLTVGAVVQLSSDMGFNRTNAVRGHSWVKQGYSATGCITKAERQRRKRKEKISKASKKRNRRK